MRNGRFMDLKPGDVITHQEGGGGCMGLVTAVRDEEYVRYVYVLWEDTKVERYTARDAPKLWPW